MSLRWGTGSAALLALAGTLLVAGPALAAEPDASSQTPSVEGPAPALDGLDGLDGLDALSGLGELSTPALAAPPAMPAMFQVPVLAKRKRDREFDTSNGEVDPRERKLPRTHRFRLAIHSHWVRLTQTQNPDTGEVERFHYAPMHLDLGYQAQFLRWVMVRIAVGVGGNVANTKNAMPLSIFPQAFVGYQGKVAGVAFGYGFDWTAAAGDGRTSNRSFALEQPVIRLNHVVMGELSFTSRIDRVALTFALDLGGMQSNLTHFAEANKRWRFYVGFHAGVFFDGTKRREKKARERAEARGQ